MQIFLLQHVFESNQHPECVYIQVYPGSLHELGYLLGILLLPPYILFNNRFLHYTTPLSHLFGLFGHEIHEQINLFV